MRLDYFQLPLTLEEIVHRLIHNIEVPSQNLGYAASRGVAELIEGFQTITPSQLTDILRIVEDILPRFKVGSFFPNQILSFINETIGRKG